MYSSCQCSLKDSGNVYSTDIILKGKLFSSTIIINHECIKFVYKHLFYSLLLLLIHRFRANSTKMATTTRHDKLRIETLLSPPQTEENGGLPFLHLPPLEMPKIHVACSQFTNNNAMATQNQQSSLAAYKPKSSFSQLTTFCLLQRRAKAKRKRASPWQTQILEQVFEQTAFPSSSLRAELGFELGMTSRSIQIWFQNKRQAVRRSIRHKTSLYP